MRLLGSLFAVLAVVGSACAQSLPSHQSSTGLQHPDLAQRSAVYVKVQLEKTVKVSALKPGDVIEGRLAQDVYSGDRELFAAGSQVHLTVDKLGRRRRVPNDYWPWVIKAFTPRHENYPTFQSATVSLPDGREVPLRVSLIFINRETQVHAPTETKKGGHPATSAAAQGGDASAQQSESGNGGARDSGPFVALQAINPAEISASGESSSGFALPGPVTLAAGTMAKIILLGGVSASKSRPGDSFQARLVEPVRLDSMVVLPEGRL
jgi:hypothetical protein